MTLLYVTPLDHLPETLTRSRAAHLVSLGAPGQGLERPDAVDSGFLSLEFNDIATEREGLLAPQPHHIEQLISAVRQWADAPSIVFQCWMGISRSTAAALIAGLVLRPNADPAIFARDLRKAAPSATPNPRMIRLADDMLALHGGFIQAVEAIGRGADAFLGKPFQLDTAKMTVRDKNAKTITR